MSLLCMSAFLPGQPLLPKGRGVAGASVNTTRLVYHCERAEQGRGAALWLNLTESCIISMIYAEARIRGFNQDRDFGFVEGTESLVLQREWPML